MGSGPRWVLLSPWEIGCIDDRVWSYYGLDDEKSLDTCCAGQSSDAHVYFEVANA